MFDRLMSVYFDNPQSSLIINKCWSFIGLRPPHNVWFEKNLVKHAALLLQLGQDTAIDLILIILQLSSTGNVRVVFVIGLLYTRRIIREATKNIFLLDF